MGDGNDYHLLGAINDASGKEVGLYLAKEECLLGYFEVARIMLDNFRIQISTYSDQCTIFFSPQKGKSLEEELAGKKVNLTQFGRAMSKLGI